MFRVEPQPLELRPIGQQRRQHRRDPARGRIGHEPHVAAQQAAVQALVEFAQIGPGQAVVCHAAALAEPLVPEAPARPDPDSRTPRGRTVRQSATAALGTAIVAKMRSSACRAYNFRSRSTTAVQFGL